MLLSTSLFAAAPSRAAETGLTPDLTWGPSRQEQNRTAGLMEDLGAGCARINISWEWVERDAKGIYDPEVWDIYDRAVQVTMNAGVKVLIMVDQSLPWAS